MKKLPLCLSIAFLTTALATARVDWLTSGDHGYAVLPPQSITDGAVSAVAWASNGEYLMVAERPIVPNPALLGESIAKGGSSTESSRLSLLVWGRSERNVRSLWGTDDPTARVEEIVWLHGAPIALVRLRWSEKTDKGANTVFGVLVIDAASGQYSWPQGLERLTERPVISASPLQSLAVVSFMEETGQPRQSQNTASTILKDLNGVLQIELQGGSASGILDGNTINFSFGSSEANRFLTIGARGGVVHNVAADPPIAMPIVWNTDGSAWFLKGRDPLSGKEGLNHLNDAGKLEPSGEPEYRATTPHEVLHVQRVQSELQHGKTHAPITSAWLTSPGATDHAELLLAADSHTAHLSPGSDAVVFDDGGVLRLRLIVPMSSQEVKEAQVAEKNRAQGIPIGDGVSNISRQVRFVFVTAGKPPVKP